MDYLHHYVLFIIIGSITGVLTGFTGASGMSVLVSGLLLLGVPIREVIALTFVVTMANSVIAAIPYGRRGNIPLFPAIVMASSAAAAVFAGYRVSFSLSSAFLSWCIIAGLVAAGVKFTFFDRRTVVCKAAGGLRFLPLTLLIPGTIVGGIMGILGGGGGVFISLILVFIYGMEAHKALGVSLVVMAAAALPGGVLYAHDGFLDVSTAFVLVAPSMLCSFIAARYANKMSDRVIKRVLGIYLMVISLSLAARNLHFFSGVAQ